MDNDEEDLLDDDTWLAQQLEHNWPAAMPEPSVVEPDEACSRKLSVMEALECILNASTDAELDAERRELQRRRLMCGVAAEDRRWRAGLGLKEPGLKRSREQGLSIAVLPLLELAEEAMGREFRRACEALLPNINWCGLVWTPAAVDHNSEPCRIKRSRPAVEAWQSE